MGEKRMGTALVYQIDRTAGGVGAAENMATKSSRKLSVTRAPVRGKSVPFRRTWKQRSEQDQSGRTEPARKATERVWGK